ncbi:MAG: helix-turn-helix transcriptional regulator [Gammaproteobacteria bacterium]|nr:helix-turn-helix transcriptional regulator [Gammaproteobacteria bacterium]MBP9728790.1 helix-turn-helix transcriptional regulator [Gammaproteobacteria bacterium]
MRYSTPPNAQDTDRLFKKKTALERGKRIKLARHLANLTRKDMLENYDINPNTIHAWEKGINCLTERNAQKLSEAFQGRGLAITKEWLLYGDDPRSALSTATNTDAQVIADVLSIRGDLKIVEELDYFRQNNPHALSAMVTDEALLPFFYSGDYVGGIPLFAKELQHLIGEFCIISSESSDVLIRKIFQHKQGNIFTIGGINPFAKLEGPDYFDCAIQSAAPITRHWHLGRMQKKD